MDTTQIDHITKETVYVTQINTGRVYSYQAEPGMTANEDIDLMKKRIAEREGIPESCIKWINPKEDYDNQEAFFKNKRTIDKSFPLESMNWMIYYELHDQRLKDSNGFEAVSCQKKDMEFQNKMDEVHANFPFTAIEDIAYLETPGWAKSLLYESLLVENVGKVIKHFNHQLEQFTNEEQEDSRAHQQGSVASYIGGGIKTIQMPIKHRISNSIIHDVDIRPFTDAQLFKLINQWNEEKIDLQRVEIHAYGYSAEDGQEAKPNEPVKTEMSVRQNMKIRCFKSMIMSAISPKPFFLQHNIDNGMEIKDLLEMTGQSDNGSEIQSNIINVYYDLQNFDLQVQQVKGGIYTLTGLTNEVTMGELEKKFKDFDHIKKNLFQTADLIITLSTGRSIFVGDPSIQNETLMDMGINRFSVISFYYKYITVLLFDDKEPKYISLKGKDQMTQAEFKESLQSKFPELPKLFSILCEDNLITQHMMVHNNSKLRVVDLVSIGTITVNTFVNCEGGQMKIEDFCWEKKIFQILDQMTVQGLKQAIFTKLNEDLTTHLDDNSFSRFNHDQLREGIAQYFSDMFDQQNGAATIREAGIEHGAEFTFNAALKDLSQEFKDKWYVDTTLAPEAEVDNSAYHIKNAEDKAGDTNNFEGYRSINLEFAKYFQLQTKKEDKDIDNKRVFRQLIEKYDKMTINQVITLLCDSYLAKDDDGQSKYPTTSVKMMNPKKEGKALDGKTLMKTIAEGSVIKVKIFDVCHLNICNQVHIWKSVKEWKTIKDVRNSIQLDDLIKINKTFAEHQDIKSNDFLQLLVFMKNKKIISENKMDQTLDNLGEYSNTQEIFVIPKTFIKMSMQFVCRDILLITEMMNHCSSVRQDEAEMLENKGKGFFKKLFKKSKKGKGKTKFEMVIQEFKELKKNQDNQMQMNAPQLIEEFKVNNPGLIDSDEEDDEIFATHIYQRQEKHWKDLFVLLNGFKEDKKLEDLASFKGMIKAYTNNATYDSINIAMRNSQFQNIEAYNTTMIEFLNGKQKNLAYQQTQVPVWRGVVCPEDIAQKDYALNSIGFFPCFTSTSCNQAEAHGFATKYGNAKHGIVFKIYLTKENNPRTHIDTRAKIDEWSFHPKEEEVLLFPFFRFVVVGNDVRDDTYDNQPVRITEVTLMEIPFQDQLKFRNVNYTSIIWLDENRKCFDTFCDRKEVQDDLQNVNLIYTETEEDALESIKNSVRCILITPDSLGATFLPSLYSGLKPLSNLNSAIVMSSNENKTKKWTADFDIIKAIATDDDSLLTATVNLSNEVNVCNVDKKSQME